MAHYQDHMAHYRANNLDYIQKLIWQAFRVYIFLLLRLLLVYMRGRSPFFVFYVLLI